MCNFIQTRTRSKCYAKIHHVHDLHFPLLGTLVRAASAPTHARPCCCFVHHGLMSAGRDAVGACQAGADAAALVFETPAWQAHVVECPVAETRKMWLGKASQREQQTAGRQVAAARLARFSRHTLQSVQVQRERAVCFVMPQAAEFYL